MSLVLSLQLIELNELLFITKLQIQTVYYRCHVTNLLCSCALCHDIILKQINVIMYENDHVHIYWV